MISEDSSRNGQLKYEIVQICTHTITKYPKQDWQARIQRAAVRPFCATTRVLGIAHWNNDEAAIDENE